MDKRDFLKGLREKLVKIKNHQFTVDKKAINKDIKGIDEVIDLLSHGYLQIMIDNAKEAALKKYGPLKNTDEFIGAMIEEMKEVLTEIMSFEKHYQNLENLKMENKLDEMNKEAFDMICTIMNAINELTQVVALLNKFEDFYNSQPGPEAEKK